jgi:hypothetical protein
VKTSVYEKRYPDPTARDRALANYQWLAEIGSLMCVPILMTESEQDCLVFERIEGRHITPADLAMLARHLGDVHGRAYARELYRARISQPYRTRSGHLLPSYPDGRLRA